MTVCNILKNKVALLSTFLMSSASVMAGELKTGVIGPQPSDATVIQGVNTAGTVRVCNLANLEAFFNIAANSIEITGLIVGSVFLLKAATKVKDERKVRVRNALFGLFTMAAGLLTPGVFNFAIAAARDANLFS